jgi:GntR family transcriptional repressor for pyruvate dehydrogenase complex
MTSAVHDRHGGRTERAADALLELVLDGTFPPGSKLPSEAELAQRFGVSRLTMREAIRSLAATRVISVSHGKSSVITAADQWSPLDPRLLLARGGVTGDPLLLPKRLIEARRMVEISAAELAAERRTDEQISLMAGFVERMQAAHEEGDVARFVEADLAFHATIFEAVDNVFVDALFAPLEQVVRRLRAETSAVPDIRLHAIAWHTAILEKVTEGDPIGARESMRGHLFQTEDDMYAYLASSDRPDTRGASSRP